MHHLPALPLRVRRTLLGSPPEGSDTCRWMGGKDVPSGGGLHCAASVGSAGCLAYWHQFCFLVNLIAPESAPGWAAGKARTLRQGDAWRWRVWLSFDGMPCIASSGPSASLLLAPTHRNGGCQWAGWGRATQSPAGTGPGTEHWVKHGKNGRGAACSRNWSSAPACAPGCPDWRLPPQEHCMLSCEATPYTPGWRDLRQGREAGGRSSESLQTSGVAPAPVL